MLQDKAPVVHADTTMDEYRKQYREIHKIFMNPENRQRLRHGAFEIVDAITKPRAINIKEFRGSEEELRIAVEDFYTNDGQSVFSCITCQPLRAFINISNRSIIGFDPKIAYSPKMIDNYGKDYALNSRGIYYSREFRSELVTVDRQVWIPSFEDTD